MWGNYADNHKGAYLIYETDNDNKIEIVLRVILFILCPPFVLLVEVTRKKSPKPQF